MNLYFHHVGENGSKEDFPKTVWADISISEAEESCPRDRKYSELFEYLKACFPEGFFNAWGVPIGAQKVIRSLKPGDGVYLVESLKKVHGVSCFASVKAYVPEPYPELSEFLWQSKHFPYVFFYQTKRCYLSWNQFCQVLNYKQNYNPKGTFNRISEEKVVAAGGVSEILNATQIEGKSSAFVRERVSDYFSNSELADLDSENVDSIYESPSFSLAIRRCRSALFRQSVIRNYDFRCCVCGVRRIDSHGRPEVEAAHIFPVSENGSNNVRNGLALCKYHHWAFDRNLFFIDENFILCASKNFGASSGLEDLISLEGKSLLLPLNISLKPEVKFIQARNHLLKNGV